MYKCKHFKLYELLPQSLYYELERQDKLELAWLMFDNRLLKTIDSLQEEFGTVTINDWFWGGGLENCGYRICSYGGRINLSQHKYGRACDLHFKKKTIDYVRNYILEHPEEFPYIRGIELDVSWLHIDIGNRGDTIISFTA